MLNQLNGLILDKLLLRHRFCFFCLICRMFNFGLVQPKSMKRRKNHVRFAAVEQKRTQRHHEFREEINNLFSRFFESGFMRTRDESGGDFLFPSVDISEGNTEITVKAEIPGVDEKDIDVSLTGKTLTIRAEKKKETKEEGKDFHRLERSYGMYKRAFELPAEVDPADVDASYKKGILTVVLKKSKESETKKITVKAE